MNRPDFGGNSRKSGSPSAEARSATIRRITGATHDVSTSAASARRRSLVRHDDFELQRAASTRHEGGVDGPSDRPDKAPPRNDPDRPRRVPRLSTNGFSCRQTPSSAETRWVLAGRIGGGVLHGVNALAVRGPDGRPIRPHAGRCGGEGVANAGGRLRGDVVGAVPVA